MSKFYFEVLTSLWSNLISEKAKKLKQAKDEAKAEILTFQKEREAQFKVRILRLFLKQQLSA